MYRLRGYFNYQKLLCTHAYFQINFIFLQYLVVATHTIQIASQQQSSYQYVVVATSNQNNIIPIVTKYSIPKYIELADYGYFGLAHFFCSIVLLLLLFAKQEQYLTQKRNDRSKKEFKRSCIIQQPTKNLFGCYIFICCCQYTLAIILFNFQMIHNTFSLADLNKVTERQKHRQTHRQTHTCRLYYIPSLYFNYVPCAANIGVYFGPTIMPINTVSLSSEFCIGVNVCVISQELTLCQEGQKQLDQTEFIYYYFGSNTIQQTNPHRTKETEKKRTEQNK